MELLELRIKLRQKNGLESSLIIAPTEQDDKDNLMLDFTGHSYGADSKGQNAVQVFTANDMMMFSDYVTFFQSGNFALNLVQRPGLFANGKRGKVLK